MTTLRDLTARVHFEVEDKQLEHLNEKIEGIHTAAERLVGLELAKMAYEWIESFTGLGEQLESAAVAAGVTTDTFQKLAYAASQNAVGQEELSGAMSRFSRLLGQARDGSKEAIKTFGKVGIGPEQLNSFADASEGMQVLADHIQGVQDPIKRTQLMMSILGRGSAKMTKFMTQGGEGIRRKMMEAQKIGAVVSEENVSKLAELEDSVSSLGLVFRAAAANLAGYFSPAIIYAIDRIKAFWVSNHEVIQQDFQKYAEKAAFALGFVIGFLGKAGEDLMAYARSHQKLIDAIADVILKFIEFKIAVSAASEAFTLLGFPIRQIGEGLSVISGVFGVIRAGWPFLRLFGETLISMASGIAEALIGIGGATGIGIVVLLVAALHDLYIFMTGGKVEDMWLYKLIMAIKSLSLGALKKLGLWSEDDGGLQAAKDTTMQMPLRGVGDNVTTGAEMDFGAPADFRYRDVMDNIGDLTQAQRSMATVGVPRSLAAPQTNQLSIEAPITVNVPANADPAQIAKATQQGVHQAIADIHKRADINTDQAVAY